MHNTQYKIFFLATCEFIINLLKYIKYKTIKRKPFLHKSYNDELS